MHHRVYGNLKNKHKLLKMTVDLQSAVLMFSSVLVVPKCDKISM